MMDYLEVFFLHNILVEYTILYTQIAQTLNIGNMLEKCLQLAKILEHLEYLYMNPLFASIIVNNLITHILYTPFRVVQTSHAITTIALNYFQLLEHGMQTTWHLLFYLKTKVLIGSCIQVGRII